MEQRLRYKVLRLIDIEGETVLETRSPGLLPFTPLMKPPAGEELMRESQFYQRQKERITRETTRETTIENTVALLETQFHPDAVKALTPALRNISDLQRLKQLHLAAAKAQDIEAFAQLLHE